MNRIVLLEVCAVVGWMAVAASTDVVFETEGTTYRLVNEGNAIWRVQSATPTGAFEETGAVQALARWMGETMPGTRAELSVTDENGAMVATAPDGSRAELRRNPFTLAFFTADGSCVQRLTRLTIAEKGTTVEGPFAADEHVLGLGERLDVLDKRGSRTVLCTSDGYNNSSRTYLTVPFFFTSVGGGVFANGFESAVADFGKTVSDKWSFAQEGTSLDLYVFAVKTPAEAIQRYVDLAGRLRSSIRNALQTAAVSTPIPSNRPAALCRRRGRRSCPIWSTVPIRALRMWNGSRRARFPSRMRWEGM